MTSLRERASTSSKMVKGLKGNCRRGKRMDMGNISISMGIIMMVSGRMIRRRDLELMFMRFRKRNMLGSGSNFAFFFKV